MPDLRQSQIQQSRLENQEDRFRKSPNLITRAGEEKENSATKKRVRIIALSKFAIISVQALLVASVAYNIKLDSDIKTLNTKIEKLKRASDQTVQTQETAGSLIRRIAHYKDLLNNRRSMRSDVEFVVNNLPQGFRPKVLSFENNKLVAVAEIASPLEFALLTSRYLGGEEIDEITLRSAHFQNTNQKFLIDFEATFK